MAEPLYRMIAEDLRRKIESGELPKEPGGPLPTESELQRDFGASRNTIREAVKWLITLGLVETRPGQGTYVVGKIMPFVTILTDDLDTGHGSRPPLVYVDGEPESEQKPTSREVRVEIQKADRVLAEALEVERGAQVVSRHQQRFIDEAPWALQTSFYPMSRVEKGATRLIQPADIEEGVITYLAQKHGIKQVGYRDSIAVRPPNPDEAWFFRLPADGRVSVFEIYRIGFDEHGNRIRLTITVYPADRNRFAISVGRVPSLASEAKPITQADEADQESTRPPAPI